MTLQCYWLQGVVTQRQHSDLAKAKNNPLAACKTLACKQSAKKRRKLRVDIVG